MKSYGIWKYWLCETIWQQKHALLDFLLDISTFSVSIFVILFWIFRPQDNLDDMSKICRYRWTLGSAPLPLKRALMNDATLNNTDDTVDIVDNTTFTNTADTTDTVNATVKIL